MLFFVYSLNSVLWFVLLDDYCVFFMNVVMMCCMMFGCVWLKLLSMSRWVWCVSCGLLFCDL